MKKILSFDYSKKIGVLVYKKKNDIFLKDSFDFTNLEEKEYLST